MKVPLEWLAAYVPIRLSPKALAERVTLAGLEVTGIDEVDGQPVLDIEVTPNRADCLSILGVAREVAAVTGQRLSSPAQGSGLRVRGKKMGQPTATLSIRIEDRIGCRRYIGRLIDGVRVKPSPEWMQRRLLACGARPINNLVDITNYVLLEYGQPLHAFDFSRLAEGTIVVRRARAQEPITTLDGIRRALPAEALVIADGRGAVAVAGIMGGLGSEVADQTTTVLLESAQFDPVTIRRAARQLGLASESSYRFERGVDPAGVEAASQRAAGLIVELAGGTVRAVQDAGRAPGRTPAIVLDPERLSRWLGLRVEAPTIRTSLARLGCRVASGGGAKTLHVMPPSFRQDLTQPVDLYEEMARLIGYDRLPSARSGAGLALRSHADDGHHRLEALRSFCAGLGMQETVTWSLISAEAMARCGLDPAQAARLANPLSQDHALLRPSLLPGLLEVVRHNMTQGASGGSFFELGRVVERGVETTRLGIVLTGLWSRDWRQIDQSDFFRLKGLIETLLARLAQGEVRLRPAPWSWAQPQESSAIELDGHAIGAAGAVSRDVRRALELEPAVWFAELSVPSLLEAPRTLRRVRVPPACPPVKRDLSILVSLATPFEAIARSIRAVAGALADRVELIDRYTGEPVPPGRHSLTFSIEYRDPARTLTAAEADALHGRVAEALISQFHAQRR